MIVRVVIHRKNTARIVRDTIPGEGASRRHANIDVRMYPFMSLLRYIVHYAQGWYRRIKNDITATVTSNDKSEKLPPQGICHTEPLS